MTALPWLVALTVLVAVLFVGWSWFMNRWDEREDRRYREELLS